MCKFLADRHTVNVITLIEIRIKRVVADKLLYACEGRDRYAFHSLLWIQQQRMKPVNDAFEVKLISCELSQTRRAQP